MGTFWMVLGSDWSTTSLSQFWHPSQKNKEQTDWLDILYMQVFDGETQENEYTAEL